MTEFFSQPDDSGQARASDGETSLGGRLGAQAADTLDPKNSLSGMWLWRRAREADAAGVDQGPGMHGEVDVFGGQSLEEQQAVSDARRAAIPDIGRDDAKLLLKQEGLTEQEVALGEAPSHKLPVLQLRINEAHERRDRQAAIARGPQGFFPDALGFVTSLGVGMLDPVNAAAFSIPVIGEARMGKIIAGAGDSILARGAAQFGVGAAKGAAGTALLQPADWWLHTQDGQDYTFAQAMESVVMGAGMGGLFHAIPGGVGDLLARHRGAVLAGSPQDLLERGLRTALPTAPEAAPAALPEEVPGIGPAHPAEILADLPPGAREDVVHGAMADIIAGQPTQAAEILTIAADHDPRLAESVNLAPQPLTPAAAREAVFDDIHQKLLAAGMGEDEAAYNAAVVAARYATRAERLGTGANAADLYRAEGLRVRRPFEASHGSPHEFERFDLSNVGTGEGAQSYGHGLYFAENEKVARAYQRATSDKAFVDKVAELYDEGFSPDEAWDEIKDNWKDFTPAEQRLMTALEKDDWLGFDYPHQAVNAALRDIKAFDVSPETAAAAQAVGNIYSVRINASHEHFLDWDKPLSQQPQAVKDIVKQHGLKFYEPGASRILATDESQLKERTAEPTGAEIYQELQRRRAAEVGNPRDVKGDVAAHVSGILSEAGVPGIKYLDQGSRKGPSHLDVAILESSLKDAATPEDAAKIRADIEKAKADIAEGEKNGTHNFVVFNDKDIEIVRKNGELVDRVGDGAGQKSFFQQKERMTLPPDIQELAHTLVRRFDRLTTTRERLNNIGEEINSAIDRIGEITNHFYEVSDELNTFAERVKTFAEHSPKDVDLFDLASQAGTLMRDARRADRFTIKLPENEPGEAPRLSAAQRAEIETLERSLAALYPQLQHLAESYREGARDLMRGLDGLGHDVRESPHITEESYDRYFDDIPDNEGSSLFDMETKLRRFAGEGRELFQSQPRGEPRRHGIPESAGEIVSSYRDDKVIKAHADYKAAKAGDGEAALRLVEATVEPKTIEQARTQFGPDAIYAPVVAREATGHNAIPANLAAYYAEHAGGTVSGEIVQANRAYHTGAGPMERLASPVLFDGDVVKGGRYVIVDDVSVMGSTLAGMADHIQKNGGEVAGVVTLVNASRTGVVRPSKAHVADIERRYGDDVRDLFHAEPAALTADEAAYIRNFRNPDALRTAATAGNRKRAARLRAKGVGGEADEGLAQRGGAEPRGRITLADNSAIIDLFKTADRSTFMHESAHLWLDELMRDAEHPQASEQLRGDRDTVLAWLGVKDAHDIGVAEHEKWAEGFETYLASGEAPSNALARAFEQFKQWMLEIYRALVGQRQPIPDEIKGVMDRMLATDREIAERRAAPEPSRPAREARSSPADVAADPRWRALADVKPDYDDPEVLAESEAAAQVPEPESLVPEKSLSALERAAADAEEVWRRVEPTLSEDERARANEVFSAMQGERTMREQIISDGVACLLGAIG